MTRRIIGAAIEVRRHMGPGLLSLPTKHVQPMSGDRGNSGLSGRNRCRWSAQTVNLVGRYRLHLVVEDKVIVEGKAIEPLAPIPDAQLLSYLRVCGKSVGLITHFPVRLLKNGRKGIVKEFPDSARAAVSKKAENGSDL